MANPLDAYLLNQIQSASPERMQIMLLSRAAILVKELMLALHDRKWEQANILTTKIANIIEHLVHYLAPNDSDLTVNLLSIYMLWNSILFSPTDPEQGSKLGAMATHMMELADTWHQYLLKIPAEVKTITV